MLVAIFLLVTVSPIVYIVNICNASCCVRVVTAVVFCSVFLWLRQKLNGYFIDLQNSLLSHLLVFILQYALIKCINSGVRREARMRNPLQKTVTVTNKYPDSALRILILKKGILCDCPVKYAKGHFCAPPLPTNFCVCPWVLMCYFFKTVPRSFLHINVA